MRRRKRVKSCAMGCRDFSKVFLARYIRGLTGEKVRKRSEEDVFNGIYRMAGEETISLIDNA